MEELLHTLVVAFLYILWILLIPLVLLAATPFVLLWPGKRRADGTREAKPIKRRYARLWRLWEGVGVGLPTS